MKKAILVALLFPALAFADRARDLGIPFEGSPGEYNAITDVDGVTVGFETIIEDLDNGKGVRTGVTAVLPRGERTNAMPVYGGWFSLNGNGEMTGTTWVEESGFVEGPIMITNTHSVGAVHEGNECRPQILSRGHPVPVQIDILPIPEVGSQTDQIALVSQNVDELD